MSSKVFQAGAFLTAAAVTLGAFGAHALKSTLLEAGTTDTYRTAVLYHFIHAIALMIVAMSPFHSTQTAIRLCYIFVAGMVCFSGSLYLLSTLGWSWLGPVTPLGGVLYIIGWVYAGITARKP